MWSRPRLRRPAHRRAPRAAQALTTVDVVFTHADLQPILHTIRTALAHPVPLDTPLRLQDALQTLIRRREGSGDVTVRRSPAALVTPEYWHIVIVGVDARTDTLLRAMLAVERR